MLIILLYQSVNLLGKYFVTIELINFLFILNKNLFKINIKKLIIKIKIKTFMLNWYNNISSKGLLI